MEKINILKEIKALDILILKKMQFEDGTAGKRPPTPTQMQILEYILKHEEEEIYQKDLESIFHLSRATVSSVLQTMEKYSLIDRVIDNADTRTKKINLNKRTKEIFENHKRNFQNLENKIVKDISDEDLEVFYKVLKKMKTNISDED